MDCGIHKMSKASFISPPFYDKISNRLAIIFYNKTFSDHALAPFFICNGYCLFDWSLTSLQPDMSFSQGGRTQPL